MTKRLIEGRWVLHYQQEGYDPSSTNLDALTTKREEVERIVNMLNQTWYWSEAGNKHRWHWARWEGTEFKEDVGSERPGGEK